MRTSVVDQSIAQIKAARYQEGGFHERYYSRYVDVEEGQFHIQVRESDDLTPVLPHRYGGSHRTWQPLIEHADPKRGLVILDQRGWGLSNEVPGEFSIA